LPTAMKSETVGGNLDLGMWITNRFEMQNRRDRSRDRTAGFGAGSWYCRLLIPATVLWRFYIVPYRLGSCGFIWLTAKKGRVLCLANQREVENSASKSDVSELNLGSQSIENKREARASESATCVVDG